MITKPLNSDDENYAQYIFDLFILCFSWQWEKDFYNGMWTTMERVALILQALGILTNQQRDKLRNNKEIQAKFAANICRPVLDYSVNKTHYVWDGINANPRQRQIIVNAPKKLVLTIDPQKNINYQQLLKNYRIHLTGKGNAYAEKITGKYAAVIDSDQYLDELRRQNENLAQFKPMADYGQIDEPDEYTDDPDEEEEDHQVVTMEPSAEELAKLERILKKFLKN